MDKTNKIKVGNYCKEFREKKLQISLTDFCTEQEENIKNVSAFENGRANNIKYLFLYNSMCKTKEEKTDFFNGLFNII